LGAPPRSPNDVNDIDAQFTFIHNGLFFVDAFLANTTYEADLLGSILGPLLNPLGLANGIKAASPPRVAVNNPNTVYERGGLKILPQPSGSSYDRFDLLSACFACARFSTDGGLDVHSNEPCTVNMYLGKQVPREGRFSGSKDVSVSAYINITTGVDGAMTCKHFEGEQYHALEAVGMSGGTVHNGTIDKNFARYGLIVDNVVAILRDS
jgi:hypothetical protein